MRCDGIFKDAKFPNICMMLYAKDLIQCADLVGRLQEQTHFLSEYCKCSGMKVNLEKIQIMVFRDGGVTRKEEKIII